MMRVLEWSPGAQESAGDLALILEAQCRVANQADCEGGAWWRQAQLRQHPVCGGKHQVKVALMSSSR